MHFNKTFFVLLSILGINLYVLNLCHNVACCALVFTSIMLVVKIMQDTFDAKKTFFSLGLLSLANIIASNNNYCINHHLINNLMAVSMLAVFVAAFLASIMAKKLASVAISSNAFYFAVGALVDSLIMAAFLLNNFSIAKVALILLTDLIYKMLYLSVAVVLYQLIKNSSIKQNYLGDNTAN